LYRKAAESLGRDPTTIERAIATATRVRAHGGHPVYTLTHLARLTGARWDFLRDVAARRRDPYLDIVRIKRNGETRPISSPEAPLMDVQRWLLRHVVSALGSHDASYAYQEGRSILACAKKHIGARWLIKLDIHDFFESIGERRVYRLFANLGYPRLLSLEMARICTRLKGKGGRPDRVFHLYQNKAPYSVDQEGVLPQGAPTSGALANATMLGTDAALEEFATSSGLIYSRYSDDMVFSAGSNFRREDADGVIQHAARVLDEAGLRLHSKKIRVIPPGARHVVLGLLVDDADVRLLPEYRRRLEVHVRGVQKFGLYEHAGFRKFDSVLSMINHVDGGIAFAKHVEPAFADRLRERWNEALASSGYPV
jgi:RNA-directed DNA polymerase